MLDQMENEIDAVVVATPDHTHYIAAMAAIERGEAQGEVLLVGAALEQTDDEEEYFFSDGTGITIIDADDNVPLLTPINIIGQVASDDLFCYSGQACDWASQ